MKAHERVAAAIRAANEAGRTGLVPFVTAGYPEPKDFISTLKAVAEVGDVVEVEVEAASRSDAQQSHRTLAIEDAEDPCKQPGAASDVVGLRRDCQTILQISNVLSQRGQEVGDQGRRVG